MRRHTLVGPPPGQEPKQPSTGSSWSRWTGYQEALQEYFSPMLVKGDYAFSGFDEYPHLQYREEPERDLAQRLTGDLIGLLIPALALALLCSGDLRRIPWSLSGKAAPARPDWNHGPGYPNRPGFLRNIAQSREVRGISTSPGSGGAVP